MDCRYKLPIAHEKKNEKISRDTQLYSQLKDDNIDAQAP